jgi:hypothetical protein
MSNGTTPQRVQTDPEVMRELRLWSYIGDWIWKRLCSGMPPEQVKRRLSLFVDEIEARR